ncbi:MAG TPA: hypothetical protein HPQ04_10925 [Rhodospirillaceae bacterium]|nr:hypothetical protein [Rhodospirillaceae bacterium]
MPHQSHGTAALLGFAMTWLAATAGGPAALAAGVPVIDGAAVAEAAKTLQQMTEQVKQLNQMLGEMRQVAETVGKSGQPTQAFQGVLLDSGLSRFAPTVQDLAGSLKNTAAVGPGVQADTRKISADLGTKPDFSSFTSARQWVKSELSVTRDADQTAILTARRARNLLAGEAAANALALALSIRGQMPAAADRAANLAGQAAAAKDVRGDLQANTAVMLAMQDEMARIQALMAAVLEVESAARLAGSDPMAPAASTPIPAAASAQQ